MFGGEEDVEDKEDGADGDGGVGDIEGGPAVGAKPNFKEIGDSTVENAIGNISGGAAENQGYARAGECGGGFIGNQQPRQYADDGEGASDKNDARPGRGRTRKKTESDARISAMHEIDEVVNDFVMPTFIGLRFKPSLGGAVENYDKQR